MRMMFELKTGIGQKRMHFVEFCNLYCLSDIRASKNICKMVKECGMHGNEGNLEQIFDWKTGRPMQIWEDNIEMDFKELYQNGICLLMPWESVD